MEVPRPPHDFLLLARPETLGVLGEVMAEAKRLPARLGQESHPLGDLWEHLMLPGLLRRRGARLPHSPMLMLPLGRAPFARVITIHELVPILYPQTMPRKYALYMGWLLSRVARAAERVIAVS